MRLSHTAHIRPRTLVIFLITLALLCAGARVPDISRPHRPKPLHRVTFELQQKNFSSQAKHHHDLVAVLPKAAEPVSDPTYGTASQSTPTQHCSPTAILHSGRAPPELQG